MSFDPASLPSMDVPDRAARLRSRLSEVPCDALLVTNLTNVRYLTGFTGSAALLLMPADDTAELVFVTDGRYRDQATSQLAEAGVEARTAIGLEEDARRQALAAAAAGVERLGLESENVTWAQKRRFGTDWFPDAELVPTGGLVESLRLVKDAGEVARIQAACAMADAALAAIRHRLVEGATEAEVALELEWQMRHLGAEGPSFETIVASGPNAAMPHHRAGARRIVEGDLVVLDFGALVDGYHSDMTRTLMIGEPSDTQSRMYEVVREAQAAGVAAVKAGAEAKSVDDACRSIIRDAGWDEAFLHATGHGVGLDIHEPPRVARTTDAMLADGQVVTVEPGVYLAEHGGVRIEDTVVVTSEGCRTLTLAPKEPHP
ncbi:MAG TPA: Xaa-Pro peptidase family protein [Acidimicrobiales bacterium]|nr:Xaa-Pro peptidase family protein [Acidimicrobiales bacterium]